MRKLLIIPKGALENFYSMAIENSISEIVEDIPPSLEHVYSPEQLPVIHTEEDAPRLPRKSDIEELKEENEALKLRLAQTERLAADTNLTQQQLIELLIDMEVL